MKTQKYGYKCLLCGDIVYQRTRWDTKPQCRCGNVFISDGAKLDCIVRAKCKEMNIVLGEGVDENILERDESYETDEYGVIRSDIEDEKIVNLKTQVLLLKE